MNDSLWAARAEDLLNRTASADPTPGGGSIAAICGAFGVGLVQMALAVTGDAALDAQAARLAALQEGIRPAADGDVADFSAVMSAYKLPRADDAARAVRAAAIEAASIGATERPLALAAAFVDAIALSREVEPLVKASIVSDVLAGRDLVIGAARAAIRTADINIAQLERLSSPAAAGLRGRRIAIETQLEELA
ncbi:cyclodeaminase/cyclohydrolase family protein [Gryllotalpicola protaetiae]|uniref:Methenyltetrahydrofolate cyclohydrolase n=1 Tax=Gryllotalpicola protaetiae TaxID=2419771 RepID=A0A387BQE6_9MICO|nr:cyclodeaminase/cyclohydrolase family protein [Gryllotalpicola protaetiae]AYG04898.1 methenyltetrahydrofolate cyclohydrolase [Gryllotalpicola protaetiae]